MLAINAMRTKVVSPETFILLDEIMSSWLGLEADYSLNGQVLLTQLLPQTAL